MTVKELLDKKGGYTFYDLVEIMKILRGEGGCPWDREQTHMSIRKNLIEETYEVVEAIDNDDPVLMCEELGDLILQAVFHAQMSAEEGRFDINDVCNGICEKLIVRHPHIFSDVVADTSDEVLKNWDAIKQQTKHQKTVTEKLNAIPPSLPALMRACKAGEKAAKVGFDFPTAGDAMKKVYEEAHEVETADSDAVSEEIGDLLFAAVNVARKHCVDPEEALYRATDKFIGRFSAVEKAVSDSGRRMEELSMAELDGIWDGVKAENGSK